MKETLHRLCEQFIVNRDAVKRVFRWESDYTHPLCANIFLARGKTVDEDALARCKQIIKGETGVFSSFRGSLEPALASMLAVDERPDEMMARALEHYGILKRDFWGSEYLALAAFLLCEVAKPGEVEEKAARGKEIYRLMKQEHPLLTSSEDSVFAVMTAFSQKTNQELIEDMEACYTRLKDRFSFVGNTLQTVSHVLAMSASSADEKTERVISLYETLRQAGVKYGRDYTLSVLAALTLTDGDLSTLADEIREADEFLSTQKGYGLLGCGKAMRSMHAAMIVSDQYARRDYVDTAAMAGTLAMIIAQQMAMCSVMAGTASANAVSSH